MADLQPSKAGQRSNIQLVQGIGDNLTPDIHDAADKIRNSGFNCRVDGNALLPRVYTDGPQNEVDLANVFRRIVNNMQYTRQTFGDDRVATELRRAQLAIASVIDMRNADQAENLLADLNRPTAKGGLGWVRIFYHNHDKAAV